MTVLLEVPYATSSWGGRSNCSRINKRETVSGFFICFQLSLHRGRGWEREVKFCRRINERNSKQVVFALFMFGFLKEFCPRL